MERDPYGRADVRFLEYLEEKERRVRRPRREHEAELLLKSALEERGAITAEALEEREMIEAAVGKRLGREQEFARPLQRAEVGRVGAVTGLRGAEAEKVRYGTEFKRGLEGTLKGIIGAKRRLGEAVAGERELGLSEAEREIKLREEAEAEAEAAIEVEPEIEAAKPLPGRGLRPSIKRALLSGRPELGLRGPLAPVKELYDIAKLLREGLGKGIEYAFPRGK